MVWEAIIAVALAGQNTPQRWQFYTSSPDGSAAYYDRFTFRKGSGAFWMKYYPKSGTKEYSYSLFQYNINCTTQKIASLNQAFYNADGSVVYSRSFPDVASAYETPIPESIGEGLVALKCDVK